MDQNNSQQTAHATKPIYKNHRRRPQNPQKGWQCTYCEMDNHTESNCFKKNRQQKQGKTFKKKQSHATQKSANQEQEEISNTAEAFFGESSGTKRQLRHQKLFRVHQSQQT